MYIYHNDYNNNWFSMPTTCPWRLPLVFFWHGVFHGGTREFFYDLPMVLEVVLMPRNSPGFSGDCVCPETLPDWCSAAMLSKCGRSKGIYPVPGTTPGVAKWPFQGVGILLGSKFPSKNGILHPGDEPASQGAKFPKFAQWKGGQGSKHWKFLLFLQLRGVDLWF